MARFDRIAVFNDTWNWIKKIKNYLSLLKKMIDSTIFYDIFKRVILSE